MIVDRYKEAAWARKSDICLHVFASSYILSWNRSDILKHIDKEYCLPFDSSNPEFWMRIEHLGRYIYAADYIKKRNINRVLDAACADGYGCIEMAQSGAEIFGIDYNSELIEKAINTAAGFSLTNLNFYNRDLNEDNLGWLKDIDLVTCFDTLEHLEDPKKFLENVCRVMNRFGTLLLSVPKAKFEPVDENGSPTNEFHLHRFTHKGIASLLETTGFSIQKVLHQPFTNLCMSLEKNVIRDTGISLEKLRSFYSDSKEAIRFFARMYALPAPTLEEHSYSIFIIAEKK